MSGGSAATGAAQSPPDGGGKSERVFLVVVVRSETVGTGESCSGARPITIMIFAIA